MAAATIAHLRQRRVQETVDRYRRKLPVIPGGRLDRGVPLAYLGGLVGREPTWGIEWDAEMQGGQKWLFDPEKMIHISVAGSSHHETS